MSSNSGRRGRWTHRRRFRRKGSRAVVSVIGAILSLLFFYALFGIFLTQYLPLWMSENESAFTGQGQSSMATLKSNVDLQVALGNPPTYSTPFLLASQGIPLIAQPTAGQLTFTPQIVGQYASLFAVPGPAGQSSLSINSTLGALTLSLPNRYFPAETFQYSFDGVVQSQGATSQVVAFVPLFALNVSGGRVGLSLSMLQLFGNATSVTSPGTVEVVSHYLYTQTTVVSAANISGTFKFGTLYPCSWWSFFQQTRAQALQQGLPSSTFSVAPAASQCTGQPPSPSMIGISFQGLTSLTLIQSAVTLVVGVGQQ